MDDTISCVSGPETVFFKQIGYNFVIILAYPTGKCNPFFKIVTKSYKPVTNYEILLPIQKPRYDAFHLHAA